MGTAKRQRQKESRASRIAAAEVARKKEQQRALVFRIVLAGLVVAVVVAVLWTVTSSDDDETATDALDSATTLPGDTLPTGPPADSVAGQPCVALSEALPAGAPEVPVQEGPPPVELVKEDLTEGEGEAVPEGATVTVDYIGVSCSTGVIFDNSYERGSPATFPLSGVIAGWTQGIPGMKVGGQRLLGIPPELAYGDTPTSPDIAPGETLWFVVELRSFEGGTTAPTETTGSTETTAPTAPTGSTETTVSTEATVPESTTTTGTP